jgi:hypothetical protein
LCPAENSDVKKMPIVIYQDRIKKFTPAGGFQSPYSHVFAPEEFSLRLKNKYNSQFKLDPLGTHFLTPSPQLMYA